ncbi:hypothetical protein M1146_06310 [Patescibacteria group bacterium]|nr:hypothetical protein [Patescibacteria group bacterium]
MEVEALMGVQLILMEEAATEAQAPLILTEEAATEAQVPLILTEEAVMDRAPLILMVARAPLILMVARAPLILMEEAITEVQVLRIVGAELQL